MFSRKFAWLVALSLLVLAGACSPTSPAAQLTPTSAPASPTASLAAATPAASGQVLVPASVIVLEPTPGPVVKADPAAGRDIAENGAGGAAAACKDCHGADGAGQELTGYPRLANLQATYLYTQLAAYQAGARQNITMRSIVSGLNDRQMRDLAAYYASLPIPPVEPVTADAAQLAPGEELFLYGKKLAWDKWLPACRACHGRNGNGAGELFPPLAGQRASYMSQTLEDWQNGTRAGDANGLMQTIARQLTRDEMDAAAAYLNNMQTPR